jgi:alpha-L-rhamnosidase
LGQISEGGAPLDSVDGICSAATAEGGVLLSIGSGTYRFTYETGLFRTSYNEHTLIGDLLEDERATAVLNKHIPHVVNGPFARHMIKSTLKQVSEHPMANVPKEKLDAILEDLAKL